MSQQMQLIYNYCVDADGQAIFSVDIHPDGSRFATGGQGQSQDASGRVVIWNMKPIVSDKDEENDKVRHSEGFDLILFIL